LPKGRKMSEPAEAPRRARSSDNSGGGSRRADDRMARKRTVLRVAWADAARADLEAIAEYIANDRLQTALSVLDRIERAAARLTRMPERGRTVPELAMIGVCGYRELVVPPWRILYRLSESTVHVLAVVDSRRDVADLLMERFVR
jgi:toxin ParE1/3/4